MDYTYDYDLDTLLESESGNSTTVGMLLYSFADVFMELNPKAKEIVSNLGFYIDIDNEGLSESFKSFSEFSAFGCTTFNASTPEGDKVFGRNYDYMDSPGMTVWTHPEDGYSRCHTS